MLVALSLGLSNFAAAISIGVSGVTARRRFEVGVIFGVFEAGMPVLGLALGHGLAHNLGHTGRWVGAAILLVTGGYALVQARRSGGQVVGEGRDRRWGLVLTGLALSIDNLAIGFALGTYHVSLVPAVALIGSVSVALSLVGLELGARIGTKVGERGELLGGLLLIGVGIAIAAGAL